MAGSPGLVLAQEARAFLSPSVKGECPGEGVLSVGGGFLRSRSHCGSESFIDSSALLLRTSYAKGLGQNSL